ncbi:putative RNA binding protein YcfA (HicA-like mRNA interferase family) [Pseudarthrobacter sp. W1I19]|nr:putative RNA binding protein YcfA (HicA-like mRNA interferase family) [Pseudarthrobacter sp. W1I19]
MGSSDYPSMDVKKLRRLLEKLGYSATGNGKGSHETLEHEKYPPLTFSGHTSKEISGGLVKKILRKDVGLSDEQAKEVLRGKFRPDDHH